LAALGTCTVQKTLFWPVRRTLIKVHCPTLPLTGMSRCILIAGERSPPSISRTSALTTELPFIDSPTSACPAVINRLRLPALIAELTLVLHTTHAFPRALHRLRLTTFNTKLPFVDASTGTCPPPRRLRLRPSRLSFLLLWVLLKRLLPKLLLLLLVLRIHRIKIPCIGPSPHSRIHT